MSALRETFGDSDHGLHRYFFELETADPLTREEEVALAARIKAGDLEARDELVRANLRFVIEVAKRFRNRGLSFADLISAGNLGLLTAAERFDGTRGFKFISYAVWWIRHTICESIAEHGRTVRLPANKLSLLHAIAKASHRLGQHLGDEPGADEIAAELGLSTDQVLEVARNTRDVCSLDSPLGDDEGNSCSLLTSDHQPPPDAGLSRAEAREMLGRVLAQLNQRELLILRLYYGLDGNEAQTLEQIGRLLDLTRERVRQLREQALDKLRQPARARALLPLRGDFQDG
ncbi:MAG: RNA polymerase sigma factor RpoD/SigA [Candidatus Latescibacteria bacterium]|nr:RNA polymerase sigma factor RpoD/SigA [Candidatus Latescibacterota bacterium]